MMMMIIMPYTIRNPSLYPMLQLYNCIISIPVRELFRAIIISLSPYRQWAAIATAHYPEPSLIATCIWFDFHSALALYSSMIVSFVYFFSWLPNFDFSFPFPPAMDFVFFDFRFFIFILVVLFSPCVSSSCARGFGVVVLSRPIWRRRRFGRLIRRCCCCLSAGVAGTLGVCCCYQKLSREFSNILIQLLFFFLLCVVMLNRRFVISLRQKEVILILIKIRLYKLFDFYGQLVGRWTVPNTVKSPKINQLDNCMKNTNGKKWKRIEVERAFF